MGWLRSHHDRERLGAGPVRHRVAAQPDRRASQRATVCRDMPLQGGNVAPAVSPVVLRAVWPEGLLRRRGRHPARHDLRGRRQRQPAHERHEVRGVHARPAPAVTRP
nr:MAG TPA: hypothetical protein [Caudoviricetes sp.]